MSQLYYYYDQEADVFYVSQGKPSAKDISEETADDVIIRRHPRTKEVVGFTILNFYRRLKKSARPKAVGLPIDIHLATPA